jgi:hypothetical protein
MVLTLLGMPQNPEGEAGVRIFDCFGYAIRRPCNAAKVPTDAIGSLVMVRRNESPAPEDRAQHAVRRYLDIMASEDARSALMSVVPILLRQMLVEIATAHHVQELHPAADPEDR